MRDDPRQIGFNWPPKDDEDQAYWAGYTAGENDSPVKANPHRHMSDLWQAWHEGYHDASDELDEADQEE